MQQKFTQKTRNIYSTQGFERKQPKTSLLHEPLVHVLIACPNDFSNVCKGIGTSCLLLYSDCRVLSSCCVIAALISVQMLALQLMVDGCSE